MMTAALTYCHKCWSSTVCSRVISHGNVMRREKFKRINGGKMCFRSKGKTCSTLTPRPWKETLRNILNRNSSRNNSTNSQRQKQNWPASFNVCRKNVCGLVCSRRQTLQSNVFYTNKRDLTRIHYGVVV